MSAHGQTLSPGIGHETSTYLTVPIRKHCCLWPQEKETSKLEKGQETIHIAGPNPYPRPLLGATADGEGKG